MSVMEITSHRTTDAPALGQDVEALLNQPEPEGIYRETERCAALLLLAGALLLSPPTPRPKR